MTWTTWRRAGVAILLAARGLGCASRGALGPDSALTPMADLYSRNLVVAAPTAIGNAIGGAVGAPVYALSWPIERSSPEAAERIRFAGIVPALVCGAVTGAPFLPLSYLAPERPVVFGK